MSEINTFQPVSYVTQVIKDTMGRWGARIGMIWVIAVLFFASWAPFLANSMPFLVVYEKDGSWASPFLQYLTTFDAMMLTLFFCVAALLIFRKVTWLFRIGFLLWVCAMAFVLTFWGPLSDMLLAEYPQQLDFMNKVLEYHIAVWVSVVLFLVMMGASAMVLFMWMKSIPMKQRLSFFVIAGVLLMPWVVKFVNPPLTEYWQEYRLAEAEGEYKAVYRAVVPFSPWDTLEDDKRRNQKPSDVHILGTDGESVDVMSRVIYGFRIALSVGFISTTISLVLGVIIGGLMGYFASWVDLIGMRLVEIFSSIPSFFLILAFIAAFGQNLYMVMLIIGVVGWPGYAMFIRAEYLKMRKLEYVQAANAQGLPLRSILFKHMLPNGVAPTLVSATFGFASAVSAESVLSFLGLVNAPSWGKLLSQALADGGGFYLWVAFPPGLAIFMTVFSYNLIGESLRDAIDPRIAKK